MKHLMTITMSITAILLIFAFPQKATAQDPIEDPDLIIGVDGLSCPFCAYGIEKKLKKIDTLEKLYINIEKGTVDLKLKPGSTLSRETIHQKVRDAGFEVRSIEYVNKAADPESKEGVGK